MTPTIDYHNLPCAAYGLTSYRYKGRYGWIMIGAKNHSDALREAARSSSDDVAIAKLEMWHNGRYCPVLTIKRAEDSAPPPPQTGRE